jgi:TolA-binding protein
MSSRSSNSPAADAEEPRKKGSRGGKRSVTHLSKAQLARKRANDREAQRNIRQRTKEHIENLEKKVKELEGGSRSSSMDRVLQRNQELEAEIDRLRSQLSSTTSTPSQIPTELSDDLYVQPKNELEWMPEPSLGWRTSAPATEMPNSMAYVTEGRVYPATPTSMGYDHELYAAIPIWNETQVFGGQQNPQSLAKGTPTWTPFHPAFSQPSRFADLQQTGFTEMLPTLIH